MNTDRKVDFELVVVGLDEIVVASAALLGSRSCDFTAHMCTWMILSNYKLFVNPLFKPISIEHVIIGSKTQWKTM